MSDRYNEYIIEHKENVERAFYWLVEKLPEIFDENLKSECFSIIRQHDASKNSRDEYEAYDAYFYGNNQSYQVVEDFKYAWLHHIHNNPHHWQYWILNNDDPKEGEVILDMPDCYIVEMICDWWAFSWKKGDLTSIFDWYDAHKDYMKLSKYTRNKVEYYLNQIKDCLKESDVNAENNM